MSKQVLPFFVKIVRCSNGERLPTLIDQASGVPDIDATLWVLTSLRGSNVSSATIEQALRSVIVLYLVFYIQRIDITKRLHTGYLLDPSEIEIIAKAASQTTTSLWSDYIESESQEKIKNACQKIVSLEKLRMSGVAREKINNVNVKAGSTAIRLGYIRAFLKWRVNYEIIRAVDKRREKLITLRDLVDTELKNKTPVVNGRASTSERIGIDRDAQHRLLQIINPSNSDNPWIKNDFIRVRNQLIVNACLALGIRRAELLGMRVKDIKSNLREILILRRPDDIEDPRLNEPNAKTNDRLLPLSSELYDIVKRYLTLRHEVVRGAHEFLIVANSGKPLSKAGLNRLFRALEGVSNLPKIGPHILRHTFCEILADDLYRTKHEDAEILCYLRRLAGWSDASDTPRHYTKRFAQERASQAGLSLQQKLYIKKISKVQDD